MCLCQQYWHRISIDLLEDRPTSISDAALLFLKRTQELPKFPRHARMLDVRLKFPVLPRGFRPIGRAVLPPSLLLLPMPLWHREIFNTKK
jgi:hypothetical protein